MNRTSHVGLFGKLPAHGDFVYRDLPTGFINSWDSWLQGFISCSQEQIGEPWLDTYLTSPIWRFCFSEGVVDQNVWAGIMLPSVDRVGRYFPFSIVTCLSPALNPLEIIKQSAWFEPMEAAALLALDGQLHIDDLVKEINRHQINQDTNFPPVSSSAKKMGVVVDLSFDKASAEVAYPGLLDGILRESLSSYSVWTTQGSQYISPSLFYHQGLPSMRGIAAMIDGQWQDWGWHRPYV